MFSRVVALCLLLGPAGFGQLTTAQKLNDFQHLAGLFAKQYAPYEWKREVERFDLLDLAPWLERARATRDDLDFYELMVEYVARLNDAHSIYTLPSNFSASLGFTVDIYDGKVLIDSVNRSRLPAADYPFQIGDELVSVDRRAAEELIANFSRYAVSANPRSTRRAAAARLVSRPQSRIPRAVELGERAEVAVRRAAGELETYSIPWTKTGLGMTVVGPVPAVGESDSPGYLAPLLALQNCRLPEPAAVLGQGSRIPVFGLPAGFEQRLGRAATDIFFSGTFESQGYRIGFIRIPNFSPSNVSAALAQFQREILYFEEHTDGLIVDEMRNFGGLVGYTNSLLRYLIPHPFRAIGFEIRATSDWIRSFSNSLEIARAQGADLSVQRTLEAILSDLQQANRENRGRTGPLPLDDFLLEREPMRDAGGALLAYTRPLMVLVDEFSASAGESFPATLQDHRRGPIFGMRTMGAGGSVLTESAGSYTEGSTGITQALMNRRFPVVTGDYPAAPYVENIGVHPDVQADYMTRENLLSRGSGFVGAFTAAMVEHIRQSGGARRP
ncbi:MAG: PDZ domain-containing protein [Acidobacteria bacterium]|nr:PDZ domain-containing protein [Acidobacteriota bacterium]